MSYNKVNASQLFKLKRQLASLGMSTDLVVSLKNETVKFKSLNSSYSAHKSAEFWAGHGFPKKLVVANTRYIVLVSEEKPETESLSICSRRLPYRYIWETLRQEDPFIRETLRTLLPDWLKVGLPWYSWIDTFTGFSENGEPRFRKLRDEYVGFRFWNRWTEEEEVRELKLTECTEVENGFKIQFPLQFRVDDDNVVAFYDYGE